MRRRGDPKYRQLIDTVRWRKLRVRILTAHPICQRCGRSAAQEVHHVIPLESLVNMADMRRLAYDKGNLIAVCHDCHRQIHAEMGKGTREERRRRVDEEVRQGIERWFGGGLFF